jgi:hypothetical protein
MALEYLSRVYTGTKFTLSYKVQKARAFDPDRFFNFMIFASKAGFFNWSTFPGPPLWVGSLPYPKILD